MAPYPIVPLFNFLAGALALLLLPWRLHSWNVGICSAIVWNAILCFCCGINAVIWKDNVDDVAPVWCEIGEISVISAQVMPRVATADN
jgi:pheromone a factor receptor